MARGKLQEKHKVGGEIRTVIGIWGHCEDLDFSPWTIILNLKKR